MIIETKLAKVVLSMMAVCLVMLLVVILVTGWDGTSPEVDAQEDEGEASVKEPVPETIAEQAMTQIELPVTRVYIDPPVKSAHPGQLITVNVVAQLVDCGISGSEILLEFDPNILQITALNLDGVLGANPLIGMEEKDNKAGILRYALARRGPTQIGASEAFLASIKFRVSDSAGNGLYPLTISEVQLTDQDFNAIDLLEIQPGSIEISP